MAFLKLIRWPNLLMIALMQYLIRIYIIESLNIPHVLDHLHYFFGVLCSVALAAGGYIINDLYDMEADEINKPKRRIIGNKISEPLAWQLYFGTVLLSVGSGYLVAKATNLPNLWMLPLIAVALLYFYAISLKKIAFIGNLVVSFLTALPVILVALFDVIPAATEENLDVVRLGVTIIAGYSLFALWSNLIREMVKDAEDFEGDKAQGYKTLAVLIGTEQIKYVIAILTLALFSFTGFFNYYQFGRDNISASYILVFINLPLLYFLYSVFKASSPLDFKRSSLLIKLIMLTGILSMVVFTLSMRETV